MTPLHIYLVVIVVVCIEDGDVDVQDFYPMFKIIFLHQDFYGKIFKIFTPFKIFVMDRFEHVFELVLTFSEGVSPFGERGI